MNGEERMSAADDYDYDGDDDGTKGEGRTNANRSQTTRSLSTHHRHHPQSQSITARTLLQITIRDWTTNNPLVPSNHPFSVSDLAH
jgi:hypothetical protein